MYPLSPGVLDSALGGSLDLAVGAICRWASLMAHYGFEANQCDPEARALALISPGGTWAGDNDNGQGSPGIRLRDIDRIWRSVNFVIVNCAK